MNPLISVIVPVYNAEQVLTATMGNLIYQSMFERYGEGSCEILLMDDCSTDNTAYILDDLRRQFPSRLRVFHLPENLGPGGARNAGMDAARGQFVGFVNCDDTADVAYYEKLYGKATEGGYLYDIVDSPIYHEQSGEVTLSTPPELAGALDANGKCNLLIDVGHLNTHLIRRELLEAHQIRTREHTASEDEDFLAEVICRAQSINVLSEALYVHREGTHARSASEQDNLVRPFSMLVSTSLSAYGRLTSLPDYESVRLGAETFYCKRLALALQLYEAYHGAGLMSEDFDRQILMTVKRAAETVITTPVRENPYSMAAIGEKARGRLQRYLGV